MRRNSFLVILTKINFFANIFLKSFFRNIFNHYFFRNIFNHYFLELLLRFQNFFLKENTSQWLLLNKILTICLIVYVNLSHGHRYKWNFDPVNWYDKRNAAQTVEIVQIQFFSKNGVFKQKYLWNLIDFVCQKTYMQQLDSPKSLRNAALFVLAWVAGLRQWRASMWLCGWCTCVGGVRAWVAWVACYNPGQNIWNKIEKSSKIG